MRRDPREIDEQEARRVSARAWGLLLGTWAVLFAVLALVVLPLLFGLCERVT